MKSKTNNAFRRRWCQLALLAAACTGAIAANAYDVADEYLCPAAVEAGGLVYFMPMGEIASEADARAWGAWVLRTFPAYNGRIIPKWSTDDPFPVKLDLAGLGPLLCAGDVAEDAGGLMYSLVGPPDGGKVSLALDARSVKDGFSPNVCATNMWLLPWGQLSNRWETLLVEDGGLAELHGQMNAIRDSGRFGMPGGTAWRSRVDVFRKRISWPKWTVKNAMDIGVRLSLACETSGATFRTNMLLVANASCPVKTPEGNSLSSIGVSYTITASADGYESMEKRLVIHRGGDDAVTEIRLAKAKPKPTAQPVVEPNAQPKPVASPSVSPKPVAESAATAKAGPSTDAPKAPAQVTKQAEGARKPVSAAAAAQQPQKTSVETAARQKEVVPEWPDGVDVVLRICAKKFNKRYWRPSTFTPIDDEKEIYKHARSEKVTKAIRHIKACHGCEFCRPYRDGVDPKSEGYYIFVNMLLSAFKLEYTDQSRIITANDIDKNIRGLFQTKPSGNGGDAGKNDKQK